MDIDNSSSCEAHQDAQILRGAANDKSDTYDGSHICSYVRMHTLCIEKYQMNKSAFVAMHAAAVNVAIVTGGSFVARAVQDLTRPWCTKGVMPCLSTDLKSSSLISCSLAVDKKAEINVASSKAEANT